MAAFVGGGSLASKFEYYLRTGRRSRHGSMPIETKFNPWHDSENGRFTFVGQGQFFPARTITRRRTGDNGFSENGGGWGGGGSTYSWDDGAGDGRSRSKPAADRRASVPAKIIRARSTRPKAASVRQQSRLTLRKDGYDFVVDAHARPRRVSGELRLQSQPRSKKVQLDASKPDRRSTDHGGHFIATRFNGPREWFNHFAQDANFNQSGYRRLENEWARAIQSGKRVFVDIVPRYRGTSMRPYKLTVVWHVGSERNIQHFPNERTGPRNGK